MHSKVIQHRFEIHPQFHLNFTPNLSQNKQNIVSNFIQNASKKQSKIHSKSIPYRPDGYFDTPLVPCDHFGWIPASFWHPFVIHFQVMFDEKHDFRKYTGALRQAGAFKG